MKNALLILMLSFPILLYSQTPLINQISQTNTYPKNTIVITGSGFSSNSAQLQVWFGSTRGTIVTCSEYAIEVEVPPQARFDNLTVVNLTSQRSAKSSSKFLSTFHGTAFDVDKFTTAFSLSKPQELWDIASGDLNNDGKPDMIVTKFFSPANDLMVLQNQSTPGNLVFTEATPKIIDIASDHVSIGDLDGDGKQDVVVSRGGALTRNSIHILKNNSTTGGAINLANPIALFIDNQRFAIKTAIRDLNADGKPEIIVSNSATNDLYIFVNQSTGSGISFDSTPVKITITGIGSTLALDVQDLNGDQLPEIIVTPFQGSTIQILKNKSKTSISFDAPFQQSVGGELRNIITADFNNDNRLDIVATSTLTNECFVLLNNSTTSTFSFSSISPLTSSSGPFGVDIADINGDSFPDIIVANKYTSKVDIFLHNKNTTSPGFLRASASTNNPVSYVMAGDLDGDGKPDLAFTTFNQLANAYSLSILRNQNCHQPTILNPSPLAVCNGQTVRLKAIPALNVTFSWTRDNVNIKTSTDPFVDITQGGSYVVTASGDGCTISTDAFGITSSSSTMPSDPLITGDSPLCSGSPLNLSTTSVADSYLWKGPNGFVSTFQNPQTISPVSALDAGEYSLEIAVGNCRSNISKKLIEVVNLNDFALTSNVPSNMVCNGTSVQLSASNASGYSYQWKKNGNNIPTATTPTLTVNEEASYSVLMTNNALSCNKEIGPTAITVLIPPTANFSPPTNACVNSDVTITNTSSVDSRANVLYSWSFGNGKTESTASPSVQRYPSTGQFNIVLNISYDGATGCAAASSSKQITIANGSPPIISATPKLICPGESASLQITGTYPTISWSTGSTGNTISVTEAGQYAATVTDAIGCIFTSQAILGSKPVPQITITPSAPIISLGESVQLEAMGAHTFNWTPPETLNNNTVYNPVATPKSTITYTVVGSLNDGCSSSTEVTVTVNAAALNIKPAPAFSPNGDAVNDNWIIDGVLDHGGCTLTVFDTRGRRIYQRTGYNNDWDGTYQGRPVPAGTYYYVFGCPDSQSKTGSVLVFR